MRARPNAAAAPATVSGEPAPHDATGSVREGEAPRPRPASQETCPDTHPTDARGARRCGLSAAVTRNAVPVRTAPGRRPDPCASRRASPFSPPPPRRRPRPSSCRTSSSRPTARPRPPRPPAPPSRSSTAAELEADGRPFVLDALSDLPGVTVDQSGPPGTFSGFAVRGAPARYVRVLVDGIEVSDPTGTQVAASLSNLLVDDVSRIEVLKGSQSALYGGQAVGGVIDITSPRAEVDGLANYVLLEGGSYDSFRGSYTATGRNERGEFAMTIARLQTDGFSSAEEADGNPEPDGYETTRVSATGTLYLTDRLSLFGSAFQQAESGGFDGFDPATFAPADAPNTLRHRQLGPARRPRPRRPRRPAREPRRRLPLFDRPRLARAVGPLHLFGRPDPRRVPRPVPPVRRAELAVRRRLDPRGKQDRRARSPARRRPNRTTTPASSARRSGSPSDPLTLTLALRYDEHSEFGGFPTGRVSAAYAVAADTVLRGSAGTGFRAPSNFELFDPTYGNPDLDPETSQSADLGIEQGFAGGRGTVTATLFWLQIDDLIDFDLVTSGYIQTDGTADSRGLELSAAYDLTDAPDARRRLHLHRRPRRLRRRPRCASRATTSSSSSPATSPSAPASTSASATPPTSPTSPSPPARPSSRPIPSSTPASPMPSPRTPSSTSGPRTSPTPSTRPSRATRPPTSRSTSA